MPIFVKRKHPSLVQVKTAHQFIFQNKNSKAITNPENQKRVILCLAFGTAFQYNISFTSHLHVRNCQIIKKNYSKELSVISQRLRLQIVKHAKI